MAHIEPIVSNPASYLKDSGVYIDIFRTPKV